MTGEHLARDVKELLALFAKHRVRFLVAGGEAVIHHGHPRFTGDIDLFYDATPLNAKRLFAALQEFWGGDVPAVSSAANLLEPSVVVQFGVPPKRIDLISELGTVDFARAWARRVRETIPIGKRRIPLPILGLSDLLQSKRDAGRLKDLDDIEHLTSIAQRSQRARRKR